MPALGAHDDPAGTFIDNDRARQTFSAAISHPLARSNNQFAGVSLNIVAIIKDRLFIVPFWRVAFIQVENVPRHARFRRVRQERIQLSAGDF
jgi:hypothetical protein